MDAVSPTVALRMSAARMLGAMVVAVVFAWPLPAAGRWAGVAALLLLAAAASGAVALAGRRPLLGTTLTGLDEAAVFFLLALAIGWGADPAALRLLLAGP